MKKLIFLFALASTFFGCKAQNPLTWPQPTIFTKWISIGKYTTATLPSASSCPRCIVYNNDSANYAFSNSSAWVYFGKGNNGSAVWGAIGGNITAQSDLINRLNQKVNYSDTALTLAPYALKVNTMRYSDTAGMLGAYLKSALGMKYSDSAAMLAPYMRSVNFTKAGIGLGNVLNFKQVVNKGGADSMQVGTFAAIPTASTGPTFYYATDSNAWYYNNRSAYTKIVGSGGGGGGTADSTTFLTRYRASTTYVPISIYTQHGIDSVLGYTPYDAANPNGYINGNQSITFQTQLSSDVNGNATGTISLNPIFLINSHAVTFVKMQQGAPKSIIGNSQSTTADYRIIIPAQGIVWVGDSLKVDTGYVLPVHRLADTSGVLRTLIAGKANSDSTIWQTKYRSDTARTNVYAALLGKANADSTVWQTKYRSDTARANVYAALLGKQAVGNYAIADSSVWQTKYRSDTGRTNVYAALLGKQAVGNYAIADSSVWQTKYRTDTMRTNIYARLNTVGPGGPYYPPLDSVLLKGYSSGRTMQVGGFKNTGADTLTGITYSGAFGKVLTQDTATGKVYRQSIQYLDSTAIKQGSTVYWDIPSKQFKATRDSAWRIVGKDSLFFSLGNKTFAVLDSAGGGGGAGSVTNLATGFGMLGGPITSTGTIRWDSTGGNGTTTGTLLFHSMPFNDIRYRKTFVDSVNAGLVFDSTLIAYRGTGDTVFKGSHDTLFVSLIRDSLQFHKVKNALGDWTFYVSAVTGFSGGDISGSGNGAIAATINNGAVTQAKMANSTASSLFFYNASGVPSLLQLGTNLSVTGTTLNAAGGGGSGGPYYPPLDSVVLKGYSTARTIQVGGFKNTGADTLTGITYNTTFGKVLTQDTATGKIYRQSIQTVDTSAIANGKFPTWSSGKFVMTAVLPAANGGTGVANGANTITLGGPLVTTGASTITFASTGATSVTLPTSGTLYGTASGSITSSALATSISDETGSGNAVFSTSPSLTTPSLGAATATSINKVTITAPATSATLTLAQGSTLATSGGNSVTLTSTTTTNVTLPSSGTLYGTASSSISSAQLATSLSDETGTNLAVFSNSPTLVTPNIGAATATTINGLTITNNLGGTLSIASGSTLTIAGATGLTFTTQGTTSLVLPTSGTLLTNSASSLSSANLANMLTDETGTNLAVFSNSPTFTGIPLAPTATAGTNTTQVATTAFTQTAVAGAPNIYNADGSLAADRSINVASKYIDFFSDGPGTGGFVMNTALLLGAGTQVVQTSIIGTATTYTANYQDSWITINTTGGAGTITLPPTNVAPHGFPNGATTTNQGKLLFVANNTSNAWSFTGSTIKSHGSTISTIPANTSMFLMYDAQINVWLVISQN